MSTNIKTKKTDTNPNANSAATTGTLQQSDSHAPARRPAVTPRADVWETAEAAHLVVELPGVGPEGLDLQVERDRLTLTATPTEIVPEGRALRVEWRPATYQRSFLLTDDADRESIDANLRHGLLTIRVPRRAESRPRSIPVRVSSD